MPDQHVYIDGPADLTRRAAEDSPMMVTFVTFPDGLTVGPVDDAEVPREVRYEEHIYMRTGRTSKGGTYIYEYIRKDDRSRYR